MAMEIQNPIGWVHFRLRGGFRTAVTASIGYAVILIGLILLSLRADPLRPAAVLHGCTIGLMGLQIGTLTLFGASTISKAVRKDINTRMIESHRFMPISAPQAIVGYVTGASTQAIMLAIINLAIGCATSVGASVPLSNWLMANGLLGLFTLCFWFGAVFCSILSPAAPMIVFIFGVACAISRGTLILTIPALSVLCGPLIGRTVFGIIQFGGVWNWTMQVSLLAELAAASFCFVGAVQKYRREDLLAFGPRMGLLILIGWLGISAIGIRYQDDFRSIALPSVYRDPQTPLIGSLVSSFLIGILPVMSAVWLRRQWLARRLRHDIALDGRAIPAEMVAISAAAFIALFGFSIKNPNWPYLAIAVGGSALAFLLSITYLLGIIYRASSRSAFIIVLFICITWMAPIGVETARYALNEKFNAPMLTWVSTCSPIGAMIAATTSNGPNPLPGIGVQFIPVVVLGLLYYRFLRRIQKILAA